MIHCFVHAPNKNGWQGEILLHIEKDSGNFKQAIVRKLFNSIYDADDFDDMCYDPTPTPDQVAAYLLRRENGMMQRLSVYKSYEDLSFDDWIKGLRKNYPYLAKYAVFLRTVKSISMNELPTLEVIK